MPFSDPIADGPVIQDSSNVAIDNGMNLNLLFKQLEEIRNITDIPIVLMAMLTLCISLVMKSSLKTS